MPEPTAPTPARELLELPGDVHQLCSYGRSHRGWFCDGTHLVTGRVSYELRLSEPTTVLMRRCARSHRYPICDGRHAAPTCRPWWRRW